MGRLPEAVEGSKARRPKELVFSRVMHDQLTKPHSVPAPNRREFVDQRALFQSSR
jgi:hypothetical protein